MSDLTATRDHALSMAGKSSTPANEAALWLHIANEIDAYLSGDDEGPDLFGSGSS